MEAQLDELLAMVSRHAVDLGTPTPMPRITLNTWSEPTDLRPGLFEPMLCLVLQGAKEVVVGDRTLRYDRACYFVASIELAASGRIREASREKPYVSVSMALDRDALAALLPEVEPARSEAGVPGFGVSPITPELIDAWLRMMRLMSDRRTSPFWPRCWSAKSSIACSRAPRPRPCGRSRTPTAACPRCAG